MKKLKIILVFSCFFLVIISCSFIGCSGGYKLNDVSTQLPDSVKTFRLQTFVNNAPYQNPQLTPALSERLRQKISGQTKLTAVQNDNAHWDISGKITDYSVTTTGVTSTNGQSQASINRLTVTVHVTINKQIENRVEEFDVSRSFDFAANLSLQAAESTLLDQMVKNLSDEIFNHIFSNWD